MSTFKRFEEIESWKKARELSRRVYDVSKAGAFQKDFGLKDQIRRACVSVMSNIAEGFERNSGNEFFRFLAIAKGSAGEVRSQLYVASDQGYLSQSEFEELHRIAVETSRLIAGLMNYLDTKRQ
jgi:four helix bundle protein